MLSVHDLDAGGGGTAAVWSILSVLLPRLCAVQHVLVLHAVVYPVRAKGREEAVYYAREQSDLLMQRRVEGVVVQAACM